MSKASSYILIVNAGSSSIKFAVYDVAEKLKKKLSGEIKRIGIADSSMTVTDAFTTAQNSFPVKAKNIEEAGNFLIEWLEKKQVFNSVIAIGHRIVHGMNHTEATLITQTLSDELQSIISYDPDHLPGEIELIKTFIKDHPQLKQVACFDTSFHATLPRVARLLPIPRRFDNAGIRRYGFHGLSYTYLMEKLADMEEPSATKGKIILAHLGSGASLAAVKDGKSIDTSMGFTPAGGFMMSTRSGDIDPGVLHYIIQKDALNAEQLNDLINHQSGLLGVSETSTDMQDLLKKESSDIRAAEAVALFCYEIKKWIGSFTVVLESLDSLVFSGGIGENASVIRSRICDGLEFMGIEIDENENEKNAIIISTKESKVKVYVIPTDEELVIAKTTCRILNL